MPTTFWLVSALGLDVGKVFPTDLGGPPSAQLLSAARAGNMPVVRRCFLDYDRADLDLDSALDAAASHSHMQIVEFLVQFGADDLNSALLSAVVRDDVKIASYLVSKARRHPATNAQAAQTLAANLGAYNCDWMLTAHRWDERRSS
jgi:hypothetical protein